MRTHARVSNVDGKKIIRRKSHTEILPTFVGYFSFFQCRHNDRVVKTPGSGNLRTKLADNNNDNNNNGSVDNNDDAVYTTIFTVRKKKKNKKKVQKKTDNE